MFKNDKYFEFIEKVFKNETKFFIKLLLDNFLKLDLSIEECFFIIYIHIINSDNKSIKSLESKLSLIFKKKEGDVLLIISSLIEKKIILYKEENNFINYSLFPLFGKLFKLWKNKNNNYDDNKSDKINSKNEKKNILNQADLYCLFEGEFRRLLSPMEIDFLKEWIDKKFSKKMIEEALKEAVLQGKLSFKYIDRILLDWEKKGVLNSKENEILKNKKIKKINKKNKQKNNYDDLYFN